MRRKAIRFTMSCQENSKTDHAFVILILSDSNFERGGIFELVPGLFKEKNSPSPRSGEDEDS